MKKRVLITVGVFIPEPTVSARLMAALAERLSDKYDVTVLRPHPTRPCGFCMPELDPSKLPYKIVELDSYTCPESKLLGRFREGISNGKACARYIEEHHDEIDFIFNGAWLIFGKQIVANSAIKYKIPYMTSVQDIYPESLLSKLPKIKVIQKLILNVLLPIDKYVLKNAVLIHTISEGMKEHLVKTRDLKDSHFVVIRNWQDESEFLDFHNNRQISMSEGNEPFILMYMGNVGPLAGLDMVVEAFAEANLDNVKLVIAGSGSDKEHLIEKAKDNRNIEFWEVPFGKVPEIQDKATAMVLPIMKGYSSSSIPSKLPAYMFSGKPILACVDKDSDTGKSIVDGKAGFISEPESKKDFIRNLRLLVGMSRKELAEMGKNGFDYAMTNFSKSVNLERYYNVVDNVISNL